MLHHAGKILNSNLKHLLSRSISPVVWHHLVLEAPAGDLLMKKTPHLMKMTSPHLVKKTSPHLMKMTSPYLVKKSPMKRRSHLHQMHWTGWYLRAAERVLPGAAWGSPSLLRTFGNVGNVEEATGGEQFMYYLFCSDYTINTVTCERPLFTVSTLIFALLQRCVFIHVCPHCLELWKRNCS